MFPDTSRDWPLDVPVPIAGATRAHAEEVLGILAAPEPLEVQRSDGAGSAPQQSEQQTMAAFLLCYGIRWQEREDFVLWAREDFKQRSAERRRLKKNEALDDFFGEDDAEGEG